MIEDFIQRINQTDITIISQEIFQHDPYRRIENLKVGLAVYGNRTITGFKSRMDANKTDSDEILQHLTRISTICSHKRVCVLVGFLFL